MGGLTNGGTAGMSSTVMPSKSGAGGENELPITGGAGGSGSLSEDGGIGGLGGGEAGESGATGGCAADQPCQPKNACKQGRTVCATSGKTCQELDNQPLGTSCGLAQTCVAGVKTSPDACDGVGSCVKGSQGACTPFTCNPAGTDCDTSRPIKCGDSVCNLPAQYCCYFSDAKAGACVGANKDCEGYPGLLRVKCRDRADCNQGEICCGTFSGSGSSLECTSPASCTSGPGWTGVQFCNSKAQSECQTGQCVPFDNASAFPQYTSVFPSGYSACAK